ncbi:hypothetical protein [Rugosimonospora africana]|uniref:Uncharacterized protein n=1 Tax=Rugosimonospora africana TaxID=556532 RepID=A0A8J3QXJ1_9ACTN|nr:hypothetical protein [Rugosimonospora africana]GIH19009.1 hypothetical protein Raf01_71810 [Rugosimonospora africana]
MVYFIVVALVIGVATVFFSTAYQVFLPALAAMADLPSANALADPAHVSDPLPPRPAHPGRVCLTGSNDRPQAMTPTPGGKRRLARFRGTGGLPASLPAH